MTKKRLRLPAVIGPGLLLLVAFQGATVCSQDPVRIALLPDVMVDSDIVTLGELARIEGGNVRQRTAMSGLDLSVDQQGAQTTISRREAQARLLIAGFDENDFMLSGPAEIQVRSGNIPSVPPPIAEAIVQHIADGLNIDPADVQVELLSRPNPPITWNPQRTQGLRLAPLDHSDRMVGRKTVNIGVFNHERMIEQFRIAANMVVHREVLVAWRPIERGELLDSENTFLEKRRFETVGNQWLGTEARGKSASRRIRAQQTIRPTDVSNPKTAKQEMLVRPRDVVTVVAEKGSLLITMSGMEVMKAGAAGDLIPLRNPVSKKIVYGRVVDSNRVELSF